jgi:hypothetical protein
VHRAVERLVGHEELVQLRSDARVEWRARVFIGDGLDHHSLADQGQLVEAIGVLEKGSLGTGKLKDHHLRMRYALADLYERAGERQSARRQFEAVAERDPSFFDVAERREVATIPVGAGPHGVWAAP